MEHQDSKIRLAHSAILKTLFVGRQWCTSVQGVELRTQLHSFCISKFDYMSHSPVILMLSKKGLHRMRDEKPNYVYYQVVSIDGTPLAYFRTIDGYKQPECIDYETKDWRPSDSFISYITPRETHSLKDLTTTQRISPRTILRANRCFAPQIPHQYF